MTLTFSPDIEALLNEKVRQAGLSPEEAERRLIASADNPTLSPAEIFGWILIIFLLSRSEEPLSPEADEALQILLRNKFIDPILRHGTAEELETLLPKMPEDKPKTGAEAVALLEREGVLGAWADREDIGDSADYARQLRRQAEMRNRA